jgi:plastocyanin
VRTAQSVERADAYYPDTEGGRPLTERRIVTRIVALAFAAAIVLGSSGPASAVTVGVRAVFNGTRYVWTPAVRTISPGTTIRWRAVNGGHNIKSRGANWSYFRTLASGTTRTRTFNRRGTFRYYCTIHGSVVNGVCSGMCGRIVVS